MDYALGDYYAEVTYVPKGRVGYPTAPLGDGTALAIPTNSGSLKVKATGVAFNPVAKISIGSFAGAQFQGTGNYRFSINTTNINEGGYIQCTLTADYVWNANSYHFWIVYRAPSYNGSDYANRAQDGGNWQGTFSLPLSTMASPLDKSYVWNLGPWYNDQTIDGLTYYVVRAYKQVAGVNTQVGEATFSVNDTSQSGNVLFLNSSYASTGWRNRDPGAAGNQVAWSWTVPSGVYYCYVNASAGGGGSWGAHWDRYSWLAFAGSPASQRHNTKLSVTPGDVLYGNIGGGGGIGYYIDMYYGGNGGVGGDTTLVGKYGQIWSIPGGPYEYQSSTYVIDNSGWRYTTFGDGRMVLDWGSENSRSRASGIVGRAYDSYDGTGPYGDPAVAGSVVDAWSYIDAGWFDTGNGGAGSKGFTTPFTAAQAGITQTTLNRLGLSNYPGYVYITW